MLQLNPAPQKLDVFYSRIPNSTFIFADGTFAAFTGGRYTTSDKNRAVELQKEIAAKHAYIYQDPLKLQITEAELDPMAEMKARIIAEYEMGQATAKTNVRGSSDQGRLNVADSSVIAAAAAGSDSGAVATVKK